MKLTYLKVQNLRALEDIEIEFGNIANIICGPNASGKSTIFEAIRLVRAVLAPRLQNEAQTVLIQMQALSPPVTKEPVIDQLHLIRRLPRRRFCIEIAIG